jgi:hypothetical protein
MYVRSGRAPDAKCPDCQAELSGVTGASPNPAHNKPHPGAPTVCAYCGAVLVFDSDVRPRKPTPEMEMRLREEYPLIARLSADVRSGLFCRRAGLKNPAKENV